MKNSVLSFLVGILFAVGLGISGMTQPQKVFGFLDILGNWDPSLMFVMIGAISVHFVSFKLISKRKHPVWDIKWHLPETKELTPALISGATLFGIGWGLGGFCPGPAFTSLASMQKTPIIFVISMLIGMLLFYFANSIFKFKR